MDDKTFNKLKQLAEKEIQFSEETALLISTRVPNLYQKYLDIYVNELRELKKTVTEMEFMYGTLYKKVKHHDNYEWGNRNEIDSQINTDPTYHQLRIKVNEQEYIVKYLEGVLDNVKRLSFSIKNYIDIQKFRAGMF